MNRKSFLSVVYISLSFFIYFNYTKYNISTSGEFGNIWLMIYFGLFATILLKKIKNKISISTFKPIFYAVVFISYLSLKIYIDLDDMSDVKQAIIGTTGGIVFFFLLGLSFAVFISELSYHIVKTGSLFGVLLIFLVLFVLINTYTVYSASTEMIRADIFRLSESTELGYQRPGNFITMQFMSVATLIALNLQFSRTRLIVNLLLYVLFTMLLLQSIFYSQVIGSNSGFVIPLACYMVLMIFVVMGKEIKLNVMYLGKIVIGTFVVLVLALIVFYIALDSFDINKEQLRIFGYGTTDSDSSLDTRFKKYANFYLHLGYSPIFGKANVELLTTGPGTYVHSLLSVLTHTGLFGFLLGVLTFVNIVKLKMRKINDIYYGVHAYELVSGLLFAMILFFALLTAFYTWAPLWFSLGALVMISPMRQPRYK